MAAIFGPQTPASAEHIRSITDVAEIPFIDTRWNYHPVNPVLTSNDRNAYTINLHPDVDTVGKSQVTVAHKFSDTLTLSQPRGGGYILPTIAEVATKFSPWLSKQS